jgi:hypothetical protein
MRAAPPTDADFRDDCTFNPLAQSAAPAHNRSMRTRCAVEIERFRVGALRAAFHTAGPLRIRLHATADGTTILASAQAPELRPCIGWVLAQVEGEAVNNLCFRATVHLVRLWTAAAARPVSMVFVDPAQWSSSWPAASVSFAQPVGVGVAGAIQADSIQRQPLGGFVISDDEEEPETQWHMRWSAVPPSSSSSSSSSSSAVNGSAEEGPVPVHDTADKAAETADEEAAAELDELISRAFRVLDTDDSGKLSVLELHSVLCAMGAHLSTGQLTELMRHTESCVREGLLIDAGVARDAHSFARQFAPMRVGRERTLHPSGGGRRRCRCSCRLVAAPVSGVQAALGRAIRRAAASRRRHRIGVGDAPSTDAAAAEQEQATVPQIFPGVRCQFGTPRAPFVPVTLSVDEASACLRIAATSTASEWGGGAAPPGQQSLVVSLRGATLSIIAPPEAARAGYPHAWRVHAHQPPEPPSAGVSQVFVLATAQRADAHEWQARLRALSLSAAAHAEAAGPADGSETLSRTASRVRRSQVHTLSAAGLVVVDGQLDLVEFHDQLELDGESASLSSLVIRPS